MTRYHKRHTHWKFLFLGIFLFAACEKTPEIEQPEDSMLAFYNASQQLEPTVIPISLDGSPVEGEITYDDFRLSPEYISSYGQVMAPVPTISGVYDRSFPWTAFLRVAPGTHTVGFYSGDDSRRLLAGANVQTRPGTRSRLFLLDSLGEYQTFLLVDEGRAEARQARIRISHLSPDAGPLELWINGQQADVPALHYREASGFLTWNIPENKADTLLRIQVRMPGGGEEVLGRANITIRHGETGHVIISGYYNGGTYEDPDTGETVTLNPDFKVRRFKYN